jgi:MFS family permease
MSSSSAPARRNVALELIMLFGVVSALGDVTYETGRSVGGPYLAYLGAGALVVGVVSGLGEFLGYALRLASGYVADRTRAYWASTFVGYGLIFAIPLLGFAGRWEIAAVLLLLERIGKAVRSPARDVLLSHATQQMGRGWGFAIHEFLDQTGAVAGPLVFALAFGAQNSYRDGFGILWLPAVAMMIVLVVARLRVPDPQRLETDANQPAAEATGKGAGGLSQVFWLYALFTFFAVGGFANFQVISYHLTLRQVVPVVQIPVLYAVAMAVDAVAALIIGKTYDKLGLVSLIATPLATLPIAFLAFTQDVTLVVVSVVLWGVVMGIHETIMRAAIADLVPAARRGFAYGIFNTAYGAAWFVAGVAMGALYDVSLAALVAFAVAMEVAALGAWVVLRRAVAATL